MVTCIQDVEGEYDHALPAHTLIEHQPEFFESLAPKSVDVARVVAREHVSVGRVGRGEDAISATGYRPRRRGQKVARSARAFPLVTAWR